MPRSAPPERALLWGLAGIALVTAWRVVLLPFDRMDLFVDDAQYWLWGQTLDWGYYSKPPLIAWILRASTEIGSDAPFWIRLPLPLIHAGTAVVVMVIGRRLFDARTGALAGFAWVSLPAVGFGSLLVSTDTPMLFCFALGMLAHLHLMAGRSAGWAAVLGAAVGTGLLAKYAMIYFVLGAGAAAMVLPAARIARRDAVLAVVVAFVLIAPNLLWNFANDLATLRHTGDNVGAAEAVLLPGELGEFLAGQFLVAGPVLFAAYLVMLWSLLRTSRPMAFVWLTAFSVPVLLIVSGQALRAGANLNWAAAAHLGVTLGGVAVLAARPRLLATALGLNLLVALALPVMATRADSLRIDGEMILRRYVGRADASHWAEGLARKQGLGTVVSDNRDLLADMFYTLRGSGLEIFAAPAEGFPRNHYAQRHPLPPGPGDVIYIRSRPEGPECRDGSVPEAVAEWQPGAGHFRRGLWAFRVPRSCWHGGPTG